MAKKYPSIHFLAIEMQSMALAYALRKVQEENIENLLFVNVDAHFLFEKISQYKFQTIFLNEEDVTEKIRSKEVTELVSQVSSIVEVRLNMVKLQRKLAEGKDVIMEGRDITTYVFPNANVKIYLDADVEERAKRRYKENLEKGINMTYEEVLEHIKWRDNNDKNKELGALRIAEDAIVIDTTKLSIEEVKQKVEEIIKKAKGEVKC